MSAGARVHDVDTAGLELVAKLGRDGERDVLFVDPGTAAEWTSHAVVDAAMPGVDDDRVAVALGRHARQASIVGASSQGRSRDVAEEPANRLRRARSPRSEPHSATAFRRARAARSRCPTAYSVPHPGRPRTRAAAARGDVRFPREGRWRADARRCRRGRPRRPGPTRSECPRRRACIVEPAARCTSIGSIGARDSGRSIGPSADATVGTRTERSASRTTSAGDAAAI